MAVFRNPAGFLVTKDSLTFFTTAFTSGTSKNKWLLLTLRLHSLKYVRS